MKLLLLDSLSIPSPNMECKNRGAERTNVTNRWKSYAPWQIMYPFDFSEDGLRTEGRPELSEMSYTRLAIPDVLSGGYRNIAPANPYRRGGLERKDRFLVWYVDGSVLFLRMEVKNRKSSICSIKWNSCMQVRTIVRTKDTKNAEFKKYFCQIGEL